ncbi:allantoate amidohydrolase [Ancylobacter amanitiformis]|uniref:Allantoate deiminase n=1 Tax=Ancylobacter amanitiformis TaxID=217069 RepID=A0ABU0LQ70_9HYPH|nr:allantoate amidohydrolase [Ancylobacter amanitiformis]MDQ0510849.1 allantoate deiminase [Ancylobacter amanitiformis]
MSVPLDIAALGARAAAMIEELGAISESPDHLTRFFLTPQHRRAADLVATWMREAGLDVSEDALGTVRGHWHPAGPAAPRLLIGSHIDTVAEAGKYDGAMGVVLGILALGIISKAGLSRPYGIDVLAFGDEEGTRFPTTLSASAAVAGIFAPASLAMRDADGVSYRDALIAYGKNPDDIPAAAYDPNKVIAYVEAHIEQGPVLEADGEPLGVVTAIAGASRLSITVTGEAGHAGTVPMRMRHDALLGAAEMALAAEKIAKADRHGMVATVGRMHIEPGSINVIPSRVVFTLDLRSGSDVSRREALERFEREAHRIADLRGLGVVISAFHEVATVPCYRDLQLRLRNAVADLGHSAPSMPSGAGHDGQAMSKLCPVGMLFVRCRGGISHNPAEYASPDDMGLAAAALVRFIERFQLPQLTDATGGVQT